ncbi:MAG: hypothetical protein ABIT96_12965 [Ferruginibacter sp.]
MFRRNFFVRYFSLLFILSGFFLSSNAGDTVSISTRQEAINYIHNIKTIAPSSFWPHLKPEKFLRNVLEDINNPNALYQGNNTNFCGYAALTYMPLHYDPLGHAKKLIALYQYGEVLYGKAHLKPSAAVRNAAGNLVYKGALDVRGAEQMWLLTLADHFKSYLNFFNRKYKAGDENSFWAGVSYGKFNRMIRTLLGYELHARGSDLRHPRLGDIYTYLQEQLTLGGTTIVFQNNAYLRKKAKGKFKPGYPTHFIVLQSIRKINDSLITMTYWDYGFETLRQVSPAVLKKIIFGVTHVHTNLPGNEKVIL